MHSSSLIDEYIGHSGATLNVSVCVCVHFNIITSCLLTLYDGNDDDDDNDDVYVSLWFNCH